MHRAFCSVASGPGHMQSHFGRSGSGEFTNRTLRIGCPLSISSGNTQHSEITQYLPDVPVFSKFSLVSCLFSNKMYNPVLTAHSYLENGLLYRPEVSNTYVTSPLLQDMPKIRPGRPESPTTTTTHKGQCLFQPRSHLWA